MNKKYLLEKVAGKGGWTYAAIAEVAPDKRSHFGIVRVKGSIDGFEISKYNLMPMGNGKLFLPVRAEIRKKIKKEAGDHVHIILYRDDEPMSIPEELLLCLEDEPKAFRFFKSLTESPQQLYVKWIYAAKTDETKVNRIAQSIDRLSKHEKFNGKKDRG